jgi:hypothetical protein
MALLCSDNFAYEGLLIILVTSKIATSHTVQLLLTFSRPECLSLVRTTHLTADAGEYMTT